MLSLEDNTLTLATSFGQQVTLSADGEIRISASKISVQADRFSLAASNVTVDTPSVNFSGILKCDTVIANSVVSTKYSPGED
jgi:phage baseplate assembly protein gpV